MCKTDEKTRNYIISLPCDKMSLGSWENWLCENELIIDFGGQKRNQIEQNLILVLQRLTFEKRTKNKSEELM